MERDRITNTEKDPKLRRQRERERERERINGAEKLTEIIL